MSNNNPVLSEAAHSLPTDLPVRKNVTDEPGIFIHDECGDTLWKPYCRRNFYTMSLQ